MKKFGIGLLVSGVLASFGFHYWQIRWELQTSNFKNDIFESEHRILRDEINELQTKPTYSQGCLDTVIRMKLDSGFEDGLLHAFNMVKHDSGDIAGYHRATEHHWAGVHYQQQQLKQKERDAKKEGYIMGRKDGYDEASKDLAVTESHPDFSPRGVQKELEPKSTNVISDE